MSPECKRLYKISTEALGRLERLDGWYHPVVRELDAALTECKKADMCVPWPMLGWRLWVAVGCIVGIAAIVTLLVLVIVHGT